MHNRSTTPSCSAEMTSSSISLRMQMRLCRKLLVNPVFPLISLSSQFTSLACFVIYHCFLQHPQMCSMSKANMNPDTGADLVAHGGRQHEPGCGSSLQRTVCSVSSEIRNPCQWSQSGNMSDFPQPLSLLSSIKATIFGSSKLI